MKKTFSFLFIATIIISAYSYALFVRANITDSALVGRWNFDNNKISGTTMTDLSASGNNGTLTNTPIITTGRIGQGLLFNGTSQYITMGTALNVDAIAFTQCTWIDRTGNGTTVSTGAGGHAAVEPVISKLAAEAETPANVNGNFFLGITQSTLKIAADFEDTNVGVNHPLSGGTAIANNVWNFICATFSSPNYIVYLNAKNDGSISTATTPESTSIQKLGIGTTLNSTGVAAGFFKGIIDEVYIYNRALSASEIAQLYYQGLPHHVSF